VSALGAGGTRRHAVLFKFFSDESYDSQTPEPRTYIVAGYFSSDAIWQNVEKRWAPLNSEYGVPRFHASHLNAKTYEYDGWADPKKIEYSSKMLKIITDQERALHAFVCGIHADEYRRIISDAGREKMGHPYLVCFKTCMALVAKEMDEGGFQPEDKIAVFIDRNPFEIEAVRIFCQLKDNPQFPYRSRLHSCTPASMDSMIALQPSDMIAYEGFRWHHDRRAKECKTRIVMDTILNHNGITERYFGAKTLSGLKDGIEATVCLPNQLVILPTN